MDGLAEARRESAAAAAPGSGHHLTGIRDGERWRAADEAQAWGYPRPITHREVECGRWVRDSLGIAWFIAPREELIAQLVVAIPDLGHALVLHGIGHPDARMKGQILTPETLGTLQGLAIDLGARKLYSLIPRELEGSPMPIRAMRRYLGRLGWQSDDLGCYVDLVGGA